MRDSTTGQPVEGFRVYWRVSLMVVGMRGRKEREGEREGERIRVSKREPQARLVLKGLKTREEGI